MPVYEPNETHDPALTSWVASANARDTDFPIQNLPFGVFRRAGSAEGARVGVAIGEMILDVRAAREAGAFDGIALDAALVCDAPSLNPLMALSPVSWSALRLQLSRLLRADALSGPRSAVVADEMNRKALLVPMDAAELLLPAETGDYTDFYASIHHAT